MKLEITTTTPIKGEVKGAKVSQEKHTSVHGFVSYTITLEIPSVEIEQDLSGWDFEIKKGSD